MGKTLQESKALGCVPQLLCCDTPANFFFLFLSVSVIYILGAELCGTGLFPGGRTVQGLTLWSLELRFNNKVIDIN